jgi:hypothetical protein
MTLTPHGQNAEVNDATKAALRPLINSYVSFYEFWLSELDTGGVPVVILNLHAVTSSTGTIANNKLAADLAVVAEVLGKAKIGTAHRWCRTAPTFDVCCGVREALSLLSSSSQRPSSLLVEASAEVCTKIAGAVPALVAFLS